MCRLRCFSIKSGIFEYHESYKFYLILELDEKNSFDIYIQLVDSGMIQTEMDTIPIYMKYSIDFMEKFIFFDGTISISIWDQKVYLGNLLSNVMYIQLSYLWYNSIWRL